MMDNLERLRRAGPLEKFFLARALTEHANVAISATYILPEAFTLPTQEYVYKALGTLISKNAALSAIPVKDDNDTWFFRLPEIDLGQTVSFQKRTRDYPAEEKPDTELCELLQVHQKAEFIAPLPFWRLIVLTETNGQRFTAIYIFHHVIADGISGKAFHETFLEALHDAAISLTSGEATRQVIQSPKLSMLPNLEAVHPCSMSFTFLLKQFFQHKIYPYRDPGLWTGPKSSKPFDIEIRQIVIPETVSTALRNRCRQNQATITSAIHTAVARSLLAHLPEEYTRLEAFSAMSSRRWLKEEEGITDQSMGVWVMDFRESFFRKQMDQYSSDSFPWEVARASCATIKQVLSREGKDTSVGLLKYADMWKYIQSQIGKDRDRSFKTSNLGVVKSAQEGESWPQIRQMMFTQPFDGLSAPLAVSSITGGDGCLVLGIIWQKGLAESEMFEGVVDGIATELHNAAN
ncbi:putative NRPS-like protein biosynthetic cluster [Aspergillus luchuensis]|uniref:Putative NRPS-like protein biosynthetic cluster n=1 Tax=Aspergillus kawachii TaxID=1069201 RepID=A0A7R7WZ14_ASPKA|nr:putative NRPS-like protein biosynthetic cluster [Aspergillus luchuensis]BCR99203.1 putative NRPS-like protein biosynthetic cluster [Aspergillus luchuensis]BCS11510.1 putative NRPS-like protein biosynthetic cluster [Aspergillus luchuensis]GAA87092.1 similar to An14g01950 [Aspergillus luchuensis IFO 4308]